MKRARSGGPPVRRARRPARGGRSMLSRWGGFARGAYYHLISDDDDDDDDDGDDDGDDGDGLYARQSAVAHCVPQERS